MGEMKKKNARVSLALVFFSFRPFISQRLLRRLGVFCIMRPFPAKGPFAYSQKKKKHVGMRDKKKLYINKLVVYQHCCSWESRRQNKNDYQQHCQQAQNCWLKPSQPKPWFDYWSFLVCISLTMIALCRGFRCLMKSGGSVNC